jgi:hypothetical protein
MGRVFFLLLALVEMRYILRRLGEIALFKRKKGEQGNA